MLNRRLRCRITQVVRESGDTGLPTDAVIAAVSHVLAKVPGARAQDVGAFLLAEQSGGRLSQSASGRWYWRPEKRRHEYIPNPVTVEGEK